MKITNVRNLLPKPSCVSSRQRILEAVRQHFRETGMSPSYREIGFRVGIAAQNVGAHLAELEADGYLVRAKGAARSILLVDRAANLSDTELKLGCAGRGWTVIESPAPGLPGAFTVEASPPWAADILARIP